MDVLAGERFYYRAALALACVSICFVTIVMLRSPFPLTLGDYAEWTYHGVLLRDVLQGHADVGYTLKNYPVPNSLTTVGLGILMLILPWKLAAKVWLLFGVVLGLVSALYLQGATPKPQGWRVLLLPVVVLLGTTFWFGFENFLFGTYFAMLLCSLLLRSRESRWLYAALLVLAFFSHMIPFGFALLVLGLYAMQKGRWRLLWQAVPALLLCCWYFAGRMLHGDADGKAGMTASVPYMTPLFAAFKVNTLLKSWGFVNPAFSQDDSVLLRLVGAKIFLILFLLNMIIAAVVLLAMSRAAWEAIRSGTERRYFWIAVTLFVVVALILPGAAAGISDPGGRMMQVALWCGMCVITTRRRWAGVLLSGCATLLLLADCYLLASLVIRPPLEGTVAGPLPAKVREFGHEYYGNRFRYYKNIDDGRMDLDIFPTALFLKKE